MMFRHFILCNDLKHSERININCYNIMLTDLLNHLSELSGVTIEHHIINNKQISAFVMNNVSVIDALNILIQNANITYVITNSIIQINEKTTEYIHSFDVVIDDKIRNYIVNYLNCIKIKYEWLNNNKIILYTIDSKNIIHKFNEIIENTNTFFCISVKIIEISAHEREIGFLHQIVSNIFENVYNMNVAMTKSKMIHLIPFNQLIAGNLNVFNKHQSSSTIDLKCEANASIFVQNNHSGEVSISQSNNINIKLLVDILGYTNNSLSVRITYKYVNPSHTSQNTNCISTTLTINLNTKYIISSQVLNTKGKTIKYVFNNKLLRKIFFFLSDSQIINLVNQYQIILEISKL